MRKYTCIKPIKSARAPAHTHGWERHGGGGGTNLKARAVIKEQDQEREFQICAAEKPWMSFNACSLCLPLLCWLLCVSSTESETETAETGLSHPHTHSHSHCDRFQWTLSVCMERTQCMFTECGHCCVDFCGFKYRSRDSRNSFLTHPHPCTHAHSQQIHTCTLLQFCFQHCMCEYLFKRSSKCTHRCRQKLKSRANWEKWCMPQYETNTKQRSFRVWSSDVNWPDVGEQADRGARNDLWWHELRVSHHGVDVVVVVDVARIPKVHQLDTHHACPNLHQQILRLPQISQVQGYEHWAHSVTSDNR